MPAGVKKKKKKNLVEEETADNKQRFQISVIEI